MHKEEKSKNAPQDMTFNKDRVPIAEETILRFFQDLQNSMQSIYSIGQRRDYVVAEMARRWRKICVNIDWASVEKEFLPPNLKSVDNITAVVGLASKEGLPLVGIPRSEIVKELVTAPTLKERISILREHFIDITDDCKSALSGMDHEAVKQCKSAIDALLGGFAAPAQSHAANVIESTLFHLFGSKRQKIVKNHSKSPTPSGLGLKKAYSCFS
ncbi:MAG: hypothetical protein M1374_09050 [Firmicutes bacterium]|nr:hypothetical protein [Bacillota bacterium]